MSTVLAYSVVDTLNWSCDYHVHVYFQSLPFILISLIMCVFVIVIIVYT